MRLKASLARIHDIITLKLSFALVDWVAKRFVLSLADHEALRNQVNGINPNTSGFDLSWGKPNLIGEVKGSIPVNQGHTFGSAQLDGLTSDVLQMLGEPGLRKLREKISKGSKIHLENRGGAVKFLGLYDSPAVRAAAHKWRQNLVTSKSWRAIPDARIEVAPDSNDFSPTTVYLVFLTPGSS